MSSARESLIDIIGKLNENPKAQSVFVTNVSGKDIDWDMGFQFNLENEESFYLEIKDCKGKVTSGTLSGAHIVMSGDPSAIVRICEGKGDFTHAISREQITVEQGKVMDVIRLTRAITVVLRMK